MQRKQWSWTNQNLPYKPVKPQDLNFKTPRKKWSGQARISVVKGIAVGKTTITAKCDKKKYTCKVTVKLSATDQKIKNLEDKLNKVEEKVDATPTPVVTPEPTATPIPTPTRKPVVTLTPTDPSTPEPIPTPV